MGVGRQCLHRGDGDGVGINGARCGTADQAARQSLRDGGVGLPSLQCQDLALVRLLHGVVVPEEALRALFTGALLPEPADLRLASPDAEDLLLFVEDVPEGATAFLAQAFLPEPAERRVLLPVLELLEPGVCLGHGQRPLHALPPNPLVVRLEPGVLVQMPRQHHLGVVIVGKELVCLPDQASYHADHAPAGLCLVVGHQKVLQGCIHEVHLRFERFRSREYIHRQQPRETVVICIGRGRRRLLLLPFLARALRCPLFCLLLYGLAALPPDQLEVDGLHHVPFLVIPEVEGHHVVFVPLPFHQGGVVRDVEGNLARKFRGDQVPPALPLHIKA
mmetsp:Transcript_69878/g.158570  ORF Transcript_69878/g.158570 Transcript_69878/m.158570 type:complete len:333 (-) Transcript_69878:446-1444(-)